MRTEERHDQATIGSGTGPMSLFPYPGCENRITRQFIKCSVWFFKVPMIDV